MKITYEDIIHAVHENDGELLATAGGQATFLLERTKHVVSFTPESSGKLLELERISAARGA